MRLAQCPGPSKKERYSQKGLQMLNIELLSVIIPALFAMRGKKKSTANNIHIHPQG